MAAARYRRLVQILVNEFEQADSWLVRRGPTRRNHKVRAPGVVAVVRCDRRGSVEKEGRVAKRSRD